MRARRGEWEMGRWGDGVMLDWYRCDDGTAGVGLFGFSSRLPVSTLPVTRSGCAVTGSGR